MPKLQYMRFYVSDYLADTVHLTTEEHGAYVLLLLHYWQTEKPLNNKNGRLAPVVHLSNERWKEVSSNLAEFFSVKRDIWTHGRVEYELEATMLRSTQNSYAGKMSARKRANQRLLNERSTEKQRAMNHKDKDKDKDKERGESSFATFAAIYPNLGNEKSAQREFTKAIARVPVSEIMEGALRYAHDPNRDQVRTYLAANWLKDDRWKDPLLPKQSKRGEDSTPTRLPPRITEEERREPEPISEASKAIIEATKKKIKPKGEGR